MRRAIPFIFAKLFLFSLCLMRSSPVAFAQAAQPAAADAQAQAQVAQQAQDQAAIEQALRAQAQQQEDQANFGGGFGQSGRGGRGSATARGRGRRNSGPYEPSAAQLQQLLNNGSITPEQYQQMSPLMSDRAQSLTANPNTAAANDSGEPKDLIALNLWVLTIDLPRAKAADDITASLVQRANDLPTVIGSRDDVRVLIGKLTVAGVLVRSREYRVTAVSGQPVSIQSGGNMPLVTASQVMGGGRGGGGGGRVNSISYQTVGTTIQFQPRVIAGGNIDVTLNYNSSEQEEARNVAIAEGDDGNRLPATRTVTQQLQVTSRVKPGAAVLVQSDILAEPNNDAAGVRTQLIVLGASIVPNAAD